MIRIFKNFLDFCQKDNKKRFINSIILGVVEAIFQALKICAIYVFIAGALTNKMDWKISIITLVIMLVSIIGSILCRNKSSILQTEGGYGACALKRIEIAEHLRYVPMGYFNEKSIGEVLSVTTHTMEYLENLATRVVMMVSSQLLTAAIVTILILIFDWRIGLILVAGLIIFGIASHFLIKKSETIAPEKVKADEDVVINILEYIEGINEVKSYKLSGEKSKKLNEANERSAKVNTKMELAYVPYIGLQSLVIKIIGAIMIICSIAFYLISDKSPLELANCFIMIISSFIIFSTLEGTSGYISLVRNVDISVNKAKEILSSPQMNLEGDKNDPINHNIKASHVSFSYDKKKIIDDVSFEIKENTTTAIVGPSGGGKTTLTKLIARFFDIDEGEITLGGKNIKDYNYDTLMKNFSFVFQKVYLFKDTIANNIRFGTPEASMDLVIDAAKKANCHDFIMKLPKGYDTVIGEDGVNLSGGERQRLSIARAIMKNAPIIVLDEATANVDPENEKELMEAIKELTNNKTIIMIAHRLKTVRNADQILVVENGKITQRGTHDELANVEGTYKNFISSREKATSWKIK